MAEPKERYGLEELPIVVAVRTALAVDDEGIYRQIPQEMRNAPVKDILNYVLREEQLSADERPWAEAVRKEMTPQSRRATTININGKPKVNQEDGLAAYLIVSNAPMPGEGGVEIRKYNLADIRVASVQEGGLQRLLYQPKALYK